jgi:hypothetical protein
MTVAAAMSAYCPAAAGRDFAEIDPLLFPRKVRVGMYARRLPVSPKGSSVR